MKPVRPKPAIIIAQLPGSGTATTLAARRKLNDWPEMPNEAN